jgi:hypothetical protein
MRSIETRVRLSRHLDPDEVTAIQLHAEELKAGGHLVWYQAQVCTCNLANNTCAGSADCVPFIFIWQVHYYISLH